MPHNYSKTSKTYTKVYVDTSCVWRRLRRCHTSCWVAGTCIWKAQSMWCNSAAMKHHAREYFSEYCMASMKCLNKHVQNKHIYVHINVKSRSVFWSSFKAKKKKKIKIKFKTWFQLIGCGRLDQAVRAEVNIVCLVCAKFVKNNIWMETCSTFQLQRNDTSSRWQTRDAQD